MKPKDLLESLDKTDRTSEHLEDKELNVTSDYGAPVVFRGSLDPALYGQSGSGYATTSALENMLGQANAGNQITSQDYLAMQNTRRYIPWR